MASPPSPTTAWLRAVGADPALPAGAKVVAAFVFYRYANSSGHLFASMATMRELTGFSRNAVRRAVAALVGFGWVEQTEAPNPNAAARYVLQTPNGAETRVQSEPSDEGPERTLARVQNGPPEGSERTLARVQSGPRVNEQKGDLNPDRTYEGDPPRPGTPDPGADAIGCLVEDLLAKINGTYGRNLKPNASTRRIARQFDRQSWTPEMVVRQLGERLDLGNDGNGDGLVVTVSDDGRGLRPGGEPGTGIRGMRERAALIGATLDVGPNADGAGCAVTLLVEGVTAEAHA